MYTYDYNSKIPQSIRAQNAFEMFSLDFDTPALASEWHELLKSSLQSVLQRSIGSTCQICYGPLKPAFCCHCIKCDKICCENCCSYINSYDRKTSTKNMVCLSCVEYNNTILMNNTNVKELQHSHNSINTKDFIQPTFVLNMERKAKLKLPEGWKSCMLDDSRVYYFNCEKWLSSWAIPKDEYSNDSPFGWQKYYDEKGNGFSYNVKTKDVRFDMPKERIDPLGDCPACSYVITNKDLKQGYCPCCNTSLNRAF